MVVTGEETCVVQLLGEVVKLGFVVILDVLALIRARHDHSSVDISTGFRIRTLTSPVLNLMIVLRLVAEEIVHQLWLRIEIDIAKAGLLIVRL